MTFGSGKVPFTRAATLKKSSTFSPKRDTPMKKTGQFGSRPSSSAPTRDFVLVRSNGVPTYVIPDIAYHYNKLVTRGFDTAIDVLGADHHGYVPRLKAALRLCRWIPDRLKVVLMQMVRLVRGGEIVKLSKRSGKAITLVTLLDEV